MIVDYKGVKCNRFGASAVFESDVTVRSVFDLKTNDVTFVRLENDRNV